MKVVIELYGVARLRAGRGEISVEGASIGEALAALERACPELSGAVLVGGRLTRHFRLSVNGRLFTSELSRRLAADAA